EEHDFPARLAGLGTALEAWNGCTDGDLLAALRNAVRDIAAKYDGIMTSNRNLKLGIVGRVKAGKSSFLNALLFDGRDRLPRAATPMTAALTHITYAPSAEEQKIVVHYYSRDDWDLIEKNAAEYGRVFEEKVREELQAWLGRRERGFRARPGQAEIAAREAEIRRDMADSMREDLKVCHELVQMARGTIRHEDLPRDGADDRIELAFGDDMNAVLREYVTAEGRCTPMVKYLELRVHDEGLQGFEVTDTPGLDDPIASRVDVTNRYLKGCDAVFLLSFVGRFLDEQDLVLVRQLQLAGVEEIYIIGTKMDAGLLQYPGRGADFMEAYRGSWGSYLRQLKGALDVLAKEGALPRRLEAMRAKPEARFVSSLMHAVSRKAPAEYSAEESHILARLGKMFPGYDRKYLTCPGDFEKFAGFAAVRSSVYQPVRARKEEIIARRIAGFEDAQSADLSRRIEEIAAEARNRRALMEKNTVASLRERLGTLETALQAARQDVLAIFSGLSISCRKTLASLRVNLRESMGGFKQIHEKADVRTSTSSSGIIFKDYHYETWTVRTASTSEAADNIEKYAVEAEKLVLSALEDMLDTRRIEHELRRAIYDVFEKASADSARADICGPVQALVAKLTIPEVDFGYANEARQRIFAGFSSQVQDSEIDELRKRQTEVLAEVCDRILARLDEVEAGVKATLDRQGATFIDDVAGKVKETYALLESQLADRE
ncbi:MAG: dynamin family protein, partial [Desulfovibrionaceae bacterium]|nr:dynamin family protein [Desulfovibrionaceae bacterium]